MVVFVDVPTVVVIVPKLLAYVMSVCVQGSFMVTEKVYSVSTEKSSPLPEPAAGNQLSL